MKPQRSRRVYHWEKRSPRCASLLCLRRQSFSSAHCLKFQWDSAAASVRRPTLLA